VLKNKTRKYCGDIGDMIQKNIPKNYGKEFPKTIPLVPILLLSATQLWLFQIRRKNGIPVPGPASTTSPCGPSSPNEEGIAPITSGCRDEAAAAPKCRSHFFIAAMTSPLLTGQMAKPNAS
jgi:hypothetical protein